RLSHSLVINRSSVATRFAELADEIEDHARLDRLLNIQRELVSELQSKLLRIRMVRFITLETRLERAVHVTALDTKKKVALQIENGEVEVDTQVIDALIEPLIHLLKNAVVHGVETPEIRRLLGKPEKGSVRLSIEA